MKTLEVIETEFLEITSNSTPYGTSYHIFLRIREEKGMKLCEMREFTKCLNLARYLSSYSGIGVVSETYRLFLD